MHLLLLFFVIFTQLPSIAQTIVSYDHPRSKIQYNSSKSNTIPFDYLQKELLIKASINGSDPLNFLFDTGATDLIVDRHTAAEESLDKQNNYDIQAVSGAVPAKTSLIGKLEMGKLVLQNVPCVIADMSVQSVHMNRHISGIIGTKFMSRYVTEIDFGRKTITLFESGSYRIPVNAIAIPLAQNKQPIVIATLNGINAHPFLVDTGAALNHLPEEVARKYTSGQRPHITHGTGLDGRDVALGTVVIDKVQLGNQREKSVVFTYPYRQKYQQREKSISTGYLQTNQLGILGNPFWQHFIVAIDFTHSRLFLRPVYVPER